jgi:hypothetical protein
LLVSDNIDAISGSLKNRIRFVFKLDILNPQKTAYALDNASQL